MLRTIWILFAKDLALEWRTRARMSALIFFALATLLMFSFAVGPDTKLMQKAAGGFLWLGILLASTLSLGESFRVESENGALDGIRLVPSDARAVFLAKAGGNTLMLLLLSVVLLPPMFALYDVTLARPVPLAVVKKAEAPVAPKADVPLVHPGDAFDAPKEPLFKANPTRDATAGEVAKNFGQMLLVLLMGCLAISAPGTIYAAIANNARARDVLLPVLLFPLLVPALLSAVKSTNLVLQGDPMNQLPSWLSLLGAFNLIYWVLGFLLFPRVIED